MIATYKKPTLSKGLCPLLPPPVLLFRFSFCLLLPTSSLHLKLPSFLTASHDDVTYVIYLTYLQFGNLFSFSNFTFYSASQPTSSLFTLLTQPPKRRVLGGGGPGGAGVGPCFLLSFKDPRFTGTAAKRMGHFGVECISLSNGSVRSGMCCWNLSSLLFWGEKGPQRRRPQGGVQALG